VYVIDYKTGRPSAEERREYISQVKNYTKIIEKLSGRKTEGRIFYIDSKEVEKI
jgi:ATP-dependent exoDNAse (exonuclease V) beta subunit